MKFASYIYRNYLEAQGLRRKVFVRLRKLLVSLYDDPECIMPVHGMPLHMPITHLLPFYLTEYPLYDRLPGRVGRYVRKKYGYLHCVDVGANIGDTIAAFYGSEEDCFFAIEPNPGFNCYLRKNWGENPNVHIVTDLCSDGSEVGSFQINERNGTASISETENAEKMRRRTLDEMLAESSSGNMVNVLKVDTDGHDLKVLRGALNLIRDNRPAVLFECDARQDPSFAEHIFDGLLSFRNSGYQEALVYDNYGYLMGSYSLDNLEPWKKLLFYQATSHFDYFDILLMTPEDMAEYRVLEETFFASRLGSEGLRRAAQQFMTG